MALASESKVVCGNLGQEGISEYLLPLRVPPASEYRVTPRNYLSRLTLAIDFWYYIKKKIENLKSTYDALKILQRSF